MISEHWREIRNCQGMILRTGGQETRYKISFLISRRLGKK